MRDIPVHYMQERVGKGLEVKQFLSHDFPTEKVKELGAHRDDHYIFFMIQSGSGTMMIDFHDVKLTAGMLYYVLPGQVHHPILVDIADGWFIAVDTSLIPPDYRDVFENQLALQQPVAIDAKQLNQCHNLLCLLEEKCNADEDNPFNKPVTHSLLQAFLGIAACQYSHINNESLNASRPVQITHEFKKLLVQNVFQLKSPSAYAAKLNVSESYLNEVLKKTTGFSVSYWILNEVMLEAKRLLYYSQLNVKEITHKLGYDDPAYFSRLFRKSAGTTPLTFRSGYRK